MSGGAGSYGAGTGAAGFAPGPGASAAATTGAPTALLYDPATRDFRLDANGLFVGVHPVDQEVAIALSVAFQSIGSVPGAGAKFRNIKRLGGPGFNGQVLDMVNQALAAPVSRGDVALLKVEIDTTSVRGRMFLVVSYTNLALASPDAPPQVRIPLS